MSWEVLKPSPSFLGCQALQEQKRLEAGKLTSFAKAKREHKKLEARQQKRDLEEKFRSMEEELRTKHEEELRQLGLVDEETPALQASCSFLLPRVLESGLECSSFFGSTESIEITRK